MASTVFRIDSFFDVFTELTLDGGQSWTPGGSPMHLTGVPEVQQWLTAHPKEVAAFQEWSKNYLWPKPLK